MGEKDIFKTIFYYLLFYGRRGSLSNFILRKSKIYVCVFVFACQIQYLESKWDEIIRNPMKISNFRSSWNSLFDMSQQ